MIAASVVLICNAVARGDDPLHVRIDRHLAEIHPGPEIPLCNDADFLRRVHLDLVGTIPVAAEARAFLADASPDKRARVVDQLLASPAHAEYMAKVFDVMLMERRADKFVKADEWGPYLLTSFQQNKPFSVLAREILSADGVDEKNRGPAKFYLEREVEPNLLTREVGRMFFGMDLQCAQCHDHPNIDDYYQSDYYGLYAFVSRSYLFQPDKKKPAVLAEKAEGDATFKSVFTDEEGATLPRLPGGTEIDEPALAKEDAYLVKPDPKKKEVRPVPKFSRRQELATRATDGSNRAFNRNLANRLWAHMMGRGLVHPVDQHHSDNPPVHPQLLELLADQLLQQKFEVKAMLRELALTRTYQRQIDLPRDFNAHADAASRQAEAWKQRAESLTQAAKQSAAAVNDLEKKWQAVEASLPALAEAEKKANELFAAAKKPADDAAKAMADAQRKLKDQQAAVELLAAATAKTKEAAAILTEDSELAGVLKILQDRRQVSEAAVTQLAQNVAALTAAAAAANKKLAEASTAAGNAKQQLVAAEKTAASLAKALAESKQKLLFDRTVVSHARGQIARLKTAVDYAEARRKQDALQKQTQLLAGQIATAKTTIAKLGPEVARMESELPGAESELAAATAASSKAKSQQDSASNVAKLVAVSFSKADQAAGLLPEDAELKAAVEKLDARARQLAATASSLDKTVAAAVAREQELAKQVQSLQQSMKKTSEELAAAKRQSQERGEQHAAVSRQLADLAESVQSLRDEMAGVWSEQFSLASVQPLSPEQLAWSILKATDYIDRQRSGIRAELDKKSPLKPEEKDDQEKIAAREQEIEKQTEAKLKSFVNRFVQLFGAAAGQPQDDFFATVDQALFVSNGGELRTWLAPADGNLTDRLQKIDDPKALAEELYLSVLTRLPTDEESADVAGYLSSAETKKPQAVQELAWALLTSAEFRFQR